MKRDKNLHPLSWDHHAALTGVVLTRKQIKSGADRSRLEQVAREFAVFHQEALIPHFRHEEEWLLPRYLRHVPAGSPEIIRLLTDHIILHKLILDLETARISRADLVPPLTALTDRLEAHARFEERELFPKIEATFTPEELETLGKDLLAETQESIVIPGGDGCRVTLSAIKSPEPD